MAKKRLLQLSSMAFSCIKIQMMQETAKANTAGIQRICKRSDQPKIETLVTIWSKVDYYVRKLNGATIDSPVGAQTESQELQP